MNRRERRATTKELRKDQHQLVAKLPDALTLIPQSEYPAPTGEQQPEQAWRSNRYMVQLYDEGNRYFPALKRLSICRVKLNKTAERWQDGLTWDELQSIKREIGFGAWYGVEVFPPDNRIINVANMRHLWILPMPLPIGWL